MKLFSRQPKRPSAVALDIGTEYVKTLVFEVQDGIAYITGHAKAHQRLSDMHAGAITDIAGVLDTAAQSLEEACTMAGNTPTNVVIGIAGELVKGITCQTVITRENPSSEITEQELTALIAEAQEKAFHKSRRELAYETGRKEIEIELVHSAVVGVTIDSYTVANPLGFTGKHVAVQIYSAYAPSVHQRAIQTVASQLGLNLLTVTTEPYAVSRCFGPQESGDSAAIFIDVGGGTTDIAVVRQGGLEGTKMFAIGGRVFTRRIATSLNIPFSEAETIKVAYSGERVDTADADRIKAVLAPDVEVWLSGIEVALEEFTENERFVDDKLFPARMYLCGGGSLLPDLKEALETNLWTEKLPFARHPEVIQIVPSAVASVEDTTGQLTSTQDVTPMALATVALDLVDPEGFANTVATRILRGLRG